MKSHTYMAAYHFLLICYLLLVSFWFSSNSFVYGARDFSNHRLVDEEDKSLVPSASTGGFSRDEYERVGERPHTHTHISSPGKDNSTSKTRQLLVEEQFGERLAISKSPNGGSNFVVTVGFGTPKRDLMLMFDTGSDMTWIQCQPCSCDDCCYPQQDAIFDPSTSSTFIDNISDCHHSMTYKDMSYSYGYCAADSLALTPSHVYSDFIFGCGQNNSKNFGEAAGVLAVGPGDYSLLSQTSDLGKIFCYCLPSTSSSTGYLLFGIEALVNCHTDNFIPLITMTNRYFVNLVGITVGQQRLDVSSSMMGQSPGTIIDSGTVVSSLPPAVYDNVRSTFQGLMSQYPLVDHVSDLMDTCYDLRNYTNAAIPEMILHFENSNDIHLDQSSVILMEDGYSCLAFAGNRDPNEVAIIGHHQHRGLNVLYDITKGEVEIGPGDC